MNAPRTSNEAWHRYRAEAAPDIDLDRRVHVWRARLDVGVEGFDAVLSEDEAARAARFHSADDRRRFVAARGILRTILAAHLDRDAAPKDLRFGLGLSGKPFLIDHAKLHFNVSHSEDLVVIAVTRTGEVGIDVERTRSIAEAANVARLVFDEAENAALLGCPAAERDAVFYKIWTRKEALLKAMGLGLPALKDPAAASIGHVGASWCLTSLPHLDGYTATLARPRGAHGVKLWSWPNAFAMRGSERRSHPRQTVVSSRLAPHAFEIRP